MVKKGSGRAIYRPLPFGQQVAAALHPLDRDHLRDDLRSDWAADAAADAELGSDPAAEFPIGSTRAI